MPQSLAYNYIHFVTSTKYRQPLILPHIQDDFYAYLAGICQNLGSPSLQIGGIEDHIHILFILSKKISLVSFVEELKKVPQNGLNCKVKSLKTFIGKAVMVHFLLIREKQMW